MKLPMRPSRTLASLLASLILAPAALQAQADPPDDDPLYDELEVLGWELTDRNRVAGVSIALIRDGELAWTLGCGYADLASEELVTADTVFNIGSISKTVAAWGAMRLVEAGKVDLDAPVESYLTRWKLPDSEFDTGGVNLRRLLSHTAGLSLHGYPGFQPGEELPSIEASLSGATNGSGDVHLISAPGTYWKYSGGGYTIAQLLIEEVTGRSFAEYMRAEVLLPLGMTSSDYRWTEEVDRAAATPYDTNGRPIGGPRFTAQAAASLQTSAADLARFAIAGMPAFVAQGSPRLLSAKTIALMQTPVPPSADYGLGYSIRQAAGRTCVGHGGANQGWMAKLWLAPETGDGIVVLTNGSNGNRLNEPIEERWFAALEADSKATRASASPAGAKR